MFHIYFLVISILDILFIGSNGLNTALIPGIGARSSCATSRFYLHALPQNKARVANVPGNLYVDESCIDCDVCRWMCPSTFGRKGVKSAVVAQPANYNDKLRAYAAMISCPTGSIRIHTPDPLVKEAMTLLPSEIDPILLPGVFHLGYHSADSFGATSYLIKRPGEGNIMIDTPRFNERLAQRIDEEGGIKLLLLTHKDDVADHNRWAKRFPGCERVIHLADATTRQSTDLCEIKLAGKDVWVVDPTLTLIHTPGHTAGSLSALYTTKGGEKALFTGDHLAFSMRRQSLDGFKRYNKGSVEVQANSIKLLASPKFSFQWLLPAHGRMLRFRDDDERQQAILNAAQDFENEDGDFGMFGVGYG